MKKQIIFRLVMLILFSFSILKIVPVNAQTKVPAIAEQKKWIKYEGSKDGVLSFDVFYNNPEKKRIGIAVYDENHNNLFEGFYNDADFHKKFQVPEGEANELLFVLRSAEDDLSQSFKIDLHLETDVAVTKL